MKARWLLFCIAVLPCAARAQYFPVEGYCENGGTAAITQTLPSTNTLQGVIPSCKINVYLTGTTTPATIYSNATGTPLPQPFTANALGTAKPGFWIFYVSATAQVDVVGSGGIAPNNYSTPVTLMTAAGAAANGEFCPLSGCPLGPFGYAPDGKVDPRNPAFAGGAVADMAIAGIGVNVSVSGSTVTAASSVFSSANVRKVLVIENAGPGNATLTGASISGNTLTAPTITGNLAPGGLIYGTGVLPGTQVISGSGSSWTLNLGTSAITAWSITSNIATFTITKNVFPAGSTPTISGLTTGSFMNGTTLTVLSTGLGLNQFEANVTHADASATETGTASLTVASEAMTSYGYACQQTIQTYTSATQVTLNGSCPVAATAQLAYMGTDSTAQMQSAITYAKTNGLNLYIPTVPGMCFLVTDSIDAGGDSNFHIMGDAGNQWATINGRSAICHAFTQVKPVFDFSNGPGDGLDGVTVVPPGYSDNNSMASAVYFTGTTGELINGQSITNSYLQGGSCDTCGTVVNAGGDQFHIAGSTMVSESSPAGITGDYGGTATSVTSPFYSPLVLGGLTLGFLDGGNQFVGGGSNPVLQVYNQNGHMIVSGDNYVQASSHGGQSAIVLIEGGAGCSDITGLRTESYNTAVQTPFAFGGTAGNQCGSFHGFLTGNSTAAVLTAPTINAYQATIAGVGGAPTFLNIAGNDIDSTFYLVAGNSTRLGNPGYAWGSRFYPSYGTGTLLDSYTQMLNSFPPYGGNGAEGDTLCASTAWSVPDAFICANSSNDSAYFGPAPTGSQIAVPIMDKYLYQTVANGLSMMKHGLETDSTISLLDYDMGKTSDGTPISFDFTKTPGNIVKLPIQSVQSNAGFFSGLVTNWLPNSNNFSASTWQVTGGVTPTINAACGANCTDQYGNPATEISWSALGNLTDVATGGCGSNCANITANTPYTIQINAKVATAPQAFEVGVALAGNVLNLTTTWATYCLPIASSGSVNLSDLGSINNNQIGAGAQTIYVSNNVTVSQGNSCTGALPTGNVQQLIPIAITESPSYIISTLPPGTSPVCPNGTDGALTTSGCSGAGGVTSVSVSVPSFAVPANQCYGSSGSATPVTFTMTGATTSMALLPGWTGNPAAYTGYGTTGGLAFDAWVSATNTGSYVICNPTASPITGSAITFIVAAK